MDKNGKLELYHAGNLKRPVGNLDGTIRIKTAEYERLKAAEAENRKLRLQSVVFVPSNRPREYCKRGISSAWDSGFESGYRGAKHNNPYTRHDCWRAYNLGWQSGVAAIDAAMQPTPVQAEQKGKS